MTKHTSGPWKISNNIGRKGELGIIADAVPCIIAIMGNAKEWPMEAKANARLIAAAPMLLDVIKQIQILNANKDCDIKWLCEQAIAQTEKTGD